MAPSRMAPSSQFALVLSGTLLAFAACGTTGGHPATGELFLLPSRGSFTTASGWDVVLDEARLVAGSLYVYAPAGDTQASLTPLGLGPSVAFAHGGHDPFGSRRVRMEWLGPAVLDLLADDTAALGTMDGSVGPATDATLAFEALRGALASPESPTRGHHAWIAGTASRLLDGETESIAFEGGLDFEIAGTENLIEAISSEAEVETDGHWALGIDLPRWLDQARFERLPGAEMRAVSPGSQAAVAWELGLRDPATFALTYQTATND
ncbi:MAG: hypothetical protein ACK6CU_20460 [Deltaproteobacteria bacterium]